MTIELKLGIYLFLGTASISDIYNPALNRKCYKYYKYYLSASDIPNLTKENGFSEEDWYSDQISHVAFGLIRIYKLRCIQYQ